MSGELTIEVVKDGAAVRRFVDFPERLYRDDPLWVPELRGAQFKMFRRQTAFFEHAEMELFLARRGGRGGEVVGRIAAIQNFGHNRHYGDTVGFFGFFECADDEAAGRGLLAAAEGWLRGRGLTVMRGPVNPSMNAECGLLIEGFDRPPMALMPYNPARYAGLLEGAGFVKCKDLYAYLQDIRAVGPGTPQGDRMLRLRKALIRRNPQVTVRPIDMRHYLEDVQRCMAVFEEARKKNWGYVPVTAAELRQTARDLRQIVDPELVLLAEVGGRPAGALLAIPNINVPLKAIGGRLFPLGFLRFFRELKRVGEIRVLGGAALEGDRTKGIAPLLAVEALLRALKRGYHTAEISWVLEDNQKSNASIEGALNPTRYKTYRIYEKALVSGQ